MIRSQYISIPFSPVELKKSIAKAKRDLKPHIDKFDTIVVTGNSGTLYGGALSLAIMKPLLLVRKPGSHSQHAVEGEFSAKSVLFVDDFIGRGETYRTVVEELRKSFGDGNAPAIYGLYLYESREWYIGGGHSPAGFYTSLAEYMNIKEGYDTRTNR